MAFIDCLNRSVAAATLLAATPVSFAQQGGGEGAGGPDARIDYDAQIMGEQTGPAGVAREGSLAAAIRDAIQAGGLDSRFADASGGVRAAAEQTYVMRVYDAVWDKVGAQDFLAALHNADAYGMAVAPALMSQVESAVRTLEEQPGHQALAEADLTLSAAFLQYADARINGAVNPATLEGIKFERFSPEPLRRYLGAAGAGALDHGRLDPDHRAYDDLLQILETYREHAESGGFTKIDTNAVVEAGEDADIVPALRRRLAEEGYRAERPDRLLAALDPLERAAGNRGAQAETGEDDSPGTTFTEPLQNALEAFQEDHGLTVDGILGPRTIAALNTPVEDKIARIEANLERWRWAPASLPERHVRVNPAAFEAAGFESGRPAITMDAIVGQSHRPTPMMADEIRFMVANPKWYVPESILERDKLETIRENPDYIPTNDYFVLDRETGERTPHSQIDWEDEAVEDSYRLVQGAGEENALGQIKFMFPNEHAIYLHGTPADHLFEDRERAFSSGCVRLERPLDMARWIVSGEGGDLDYQSVIEAVDSGETTRLPLENPVPVYLLYFTVEDGGAGQGVFHEDIYGRDGRLITALDANPISMTTSGGA
ncbi:MAG: L,D-transpeptidase family protein [Oceanicaulis sp.]